MHLLRPPAPQQKLAGPPGELVARHLNGHQLQLQLQVQHQHQQGTMLLLC
jgi:hypothetical protein